MNKLDLRTRSRNGTRSYVGDSLYRIFLHLFRFSLIYFIRFSSFSHIDPVYKFLDTYISSFGANVNGIVFLFQILVVHCPY